jgi:hypothetical protein
MATTSEYPLLAGASCSDTRKDLTPINGISALYRLFSCNNNKGLICKARKGFPVPTGWQNLVWPRFCRLLFCQATILLIFVFFFTHGALAESSTGFEFNTVTAEKYAQGALIEWSTPQPSEIERVNAAIQTKPIILSGVNGEGKKLVLVLYRDTIGSFNVGLFVNKDGKLEIDSMGSTSDPVEKIIDQFNVEPFTWGSMDDGGN